MATRAQLAEIRDRYQVKPRNWLELEVGYEGQGCATFSSNPGTIRGPVSVLYREDGAPERFEMTVDELVAEERPGKGAALDVFHFLHAQPIPG